MLSLSVWSLLMNVILKENIFFKFSIIKKFDELLFW